MNDDITIRDRLLFALTGSSGAVDAISFVALGKVFTAFMTGNVAFLGLAIARDPLAPGIRAVLTSMAGFAAGVYLAMRLVTPSGPSEPNRGDCAPALVWPRQTTYALTLSILPHLCFALIWLCHLPTEQPPCRLISVLGHLLIQISTICHSHIKEK